MVEKKSPLVMPPDFNELPLPQQPNQSIDNKKETDIKSLLTNNNDVGQDNQNTNLGKAGRNRWLGKRPSVRGVAMNPVDHPHGGGEGRTSGGRHPVTPWGKPTKGYRTRNNKRTDKLIIRRRKV